jgi:hypothetical protein
VNQKKEFLMDWKGIATVLLEAWGRSALSRFFTVLVTVGAGLLGIGWPEVMASALDKAFSREPGTTELWAPITGVVLIAFGIAGRLTIHVRASRRAEVQLATLLIGQIHELIHNLAAARLLTARAADGSPLFSPSTGAQLFYIALMRLAATASFSESRRALRLAAMSRFAGDPLLAERLSALASAFDSVGILPT